MNKKILEKNKIVLITFIIAIILFSFIVSQDECHLDNCNEDHCIWCSIIHIAQNIINISIAIIVTITISFLLSFYLLKLKLIQVLFALDSLVFQKVQLNE